jgi:HEAT repeat protein
MRILFLMPVVLASVAYAQTREAGADQKRAREILETLLKDKNPETRTQAVQALGLVSPTEPYLSELASAMDDKDVEVQVAAISAMVDLRSKRTVPALHKALESEVPEVSFAAAKALWTLNDPKGREALLAVLNGEMKTSSGFLTKQKREALRMLHTPKTTFMFAVKTGAGFAPVPGLGTGISSLQGILSDPSVSGRAATALMLSGDRNPDVLPALQDALSDSDWSVRASAVHAIALRNDRSQASKLIPLLDDKKEAVRVRAAAAYLRLTEMRLPTTRPTATPARLPKP